MVNGFVETWNLTRGRFSDSFAGWSHDQLHFRCFPDSMTAAEMALHVAGVEVRFSSDLLQIPLTESQKRLANCATDGSLNDNPFPFSKEEMTADFIRESLELSAEFAKKLFEADPHVYEREIKSALGPMINGYGAMARIAFHSGYHGAQVYMTKCSPDFPG